MKVFRITIAAAAVATMAACSPTEYRVERSTEIDAPPQVVFENVNTIANREAWSPWERMDPDMEKTYEGPQSGVGAIYKWSGNDSVGTGTLEILESRPPNYIKSRLTFAEPFESQSTIEWNFEDIPGGTRATWAVSGELPGYLFWMDQDDMESTMAPDFERGLADLKKVSEQQAASKTHASRSFNAEIVEVEAKPYYYIQDEVRFQDLDGKFFETRYGKIMSYLGSDARNLLGAPFALYPKWDEENQMGEVAVAVACRSDKPAEGEIQKDQTYAGTTLMCEHMGPYDRTGEAHEFLHRYAAEQGYEFTGTPWEVFVTDPGEEPDSSKWITEIYYPIAMP